MTAAFRSAMFTGAVWLVLVTGCTAPPPPQLEGALAIEGSTTVAPIISMVIAQLKTDAPRLALTLTVDGSGKGIAAAGNGTADLGLSSRALTDADLASFPDLVADSFARDGLQIVVGSSNPTPSLTLAQVQALFSGKISNFNEVGGPDLPVVLAVRAKGSGTADFFGASVMRGVAVSSGATAFDLSSNLVAFVASHPGAIGYVGLGYPGVRAVPLDEYGLLRTPDERSVRSGEYPLSRDLYVVSKGPLTDLRARFFDYLLSLDGQQAVVAAGYVPVR